MKNWQTFLGCLALSAGIWLIHNLSHIQTGVVTVDVLAESNIDGRAARSAEAVPLTARCKASGFRLLWLGHRKGTVVVRFDSEDFVHEEGDFFSISATQLYRYVNDIYGSGTSVESFLFDKVSYRFTSELYRRLPVTANVSMSFRPQYMQTGEIALKPDSVLVYGPADVISRLNSIKTTPIVRSDVKGNLHGEAELETPSGVRLSQTSVDWSMEVSRFVEIPATLPVTVRNVPQNSSLIVYPSTVEVLFKCVFPLYEDPAARTVLYVDYREFAVSRTGQCVIHADNLPKGVIEVRRTPEVAECIEKL